MMPQKKITFSTVILTVAAVGQIILTYLLFDPEADALCTNIGWGVLMLSAVFGWWPILTFRRKGRVRGRGYIHTTVVVDKGLYAVVRHPQYLAGILMSAAMCLITRHWLVAILGAAAVVLYYWDTFDEERVCVEKFGDAYKQYRRRVPRINFVLGWARALVRAIKRNGRQITE